jgi:hypothetical protein
MSDPFKRDIPDGLDEIKGKPRVQHGEPEVGRTKRRGDVSQSEPDAADPQPTTSDESQAQDEQDRQLKTGEENAG